MMKRLATVCIALALAFCMALSVPPERVQGADDDDAAIAQFLSIGFANADTDFASLRGALVDQSGIYMATTWPDQTHFRTCQVYYHTKLAASAGVPEASDYLCASTFRAEREPELFARVTAIVRDHLPPGYRIANLAKGAVGIEFEGWWKPHEPTVQVTTDTDDGRLFYELEMQKP